MFVCFKLSLSLVNWDMSGLVWWDGERESKCRGVEVESLGDYLLVLPLKHIFPLLLKSIPVS